MYLGCHWTDSGFNLYCHVLSNHPLLINRPVNGIAML
jgi:hypothetical protein